MNPCNAAVSGTTRLAGVIGWPIGHTLSPAMQNAAFRSLGLDAVYVPWGVLPPGLRPLLAGLAAVNALGVNVTIPYKEKVIPFLDELAPTAERMGAVNTIVFRSGRLIGHNTDGPGFLASLRGTLVLRGKRAVLLGGGGAGRAVAVSLLDAGVKHLGVVEVNAPRLEQLLRHLHGLGFRTVSGCAPSDPDLRAQVRVADLVVNATPLGLKREDPLPLPISGVARHAVLMDLVYGRSLTHWLKSGQAAGLRVIPGWRMLLHQGAKSFQLWTGRPAPLKVMERALVQAGKIRT